jgi:hypothetical protein
MQDRTPMTTKGVCVCVCARVHLPLIDHEPLRLAYGSYWTVYLYENIFRKYILVFMPIKIHCQ